MCPFYTEIDEMRQEKQWFHCFSDVAQNAPGSTSLGRRFHPSVHVGRHRRIRPPVNPRSARFLHVLACDRPHFQHPSSSSGLQLQAQQSAIDSRQSTFDDRQSAIDSRRSTIVQPPAPAPSSSLQPQLDKRQATAALTLTFILTLTLTSTGDSDFDFDFGSP